MRLYDESRILVPGQSSWCLRLNKSQARPLEQRTCALEMEGEMALDSRKRNEVSDLGVLGMTFGLVGLLAVVVVLAWLLGWI